MGRKRKGENINGWFNLYKPAGVTSTDAVNILKRKFRPQKIGHGGTLDPLAIGVLPIALGEATKTISYCQDSLKVYSFSINWGRSTTTDDAEGDVLQTSDIRPSQADIERVLPDFTGNIMQIPPKFSAIKIEGQRAYDLARAGEDVEMKARPAYIKALEVLETEQDHARFRCTCGKGTYMRSLARDIAVALGTTGHITNLKRERVGSMHAHNAISLEILEEMEQSAALKDALLPVETMLDDIPALALKENEANRLKQGQALLFVARPDVERLRQAGIDIKSETTALALWQNKAIALVTCKSAEIRPLRLLNVQNV